MSKINKLFNLEIKLIDKKLDSMIKNKSTKDLYLKYLDSIFKKFQNNLDKLEIRQLIFIANLINKAILNYNGARTIIIDEYQYFLNNLYKNLFKNKKLHNLNSFIKVEICIFDDKELDYLVYLLTDYKKIFEKVKFKLRFLNNFDSTNLDNYFTLKYLEKNYPIIYKKENLELFINSNYTRLAMNQKDKAEKILIKLKSI